MIKLSTMVIGEVMSGAQRLADARLAACTERTARDCPTASTRPTLLRLCGGVQQVYAVFGDAFRHDCLTGWVCPGQAQTIGEEVVAGPGKKEIGLGVFEVVW
jgi:hypothetical protein